MKLHGSIALLALLLPLAACGSSGEQRAASGGLSGAAAGALVAGPVGAVVGAAAGGGGGAAMEEGVDKKVEDATRDDPQAGERPAGEARTGQQ